MKPTTKQELIAGIQQFWSTVDVEKCRRYIRHLKKVLPKMVEVNGDATGCVCVSGAVKYKVIQFDHYCFSHRPILPSRCKCMEVARLASTEWKCGKTSCMQGLHRPVETVWEQGLTYVTLLEEQVCLHDNNLPLLFPEPPVLADCCSSSFRSCKEEKRIINQLTQEQLLLGVSFPCLVLIT